MEDAGEVRALIWMKRRLMLAFAVAASVLAASVLGAQPDPQPMPPHTTTTTVPPQSLELHDLEATVVLHLTGRPMDADKLAEHVAATIGARFVPERGH